MNTHRIVSALVIGFALVGCSVGSVDQDGTSDLTEETSSNASRLTLPETQRPGPDTGNPLPPKFEPRVDPLGDPTEDGVASWAKGVLVDEAPQPWKLQNPAAQGGCKCKMLCTERDGHRECIENCVGTGC